MPSALVPVSATKKVENENDKAKLENMVADPSNPVPYLPNELIGEIACNVEESKDLANLLKVSKRFNVASQYALGKHLETVTVYPRIECMEALLAAVKGGAAVYVRNITLLAEGLKEHEYGYAWAWENVENWTGVYFGDDDIKIMNEINAAHEEDMAINGHFITSGKYREMLTVLLGQFPNLETVTCRKLAVGEQIPGWAGVDMFKKLSFYCEELDTRSIFYGDWMYDTLHGRITHYCDEFGDLVCEPNSGPQASFIDDVKAALSETCLDVKVVCMPTDR